MDYKKIKNYEKQNYEKLVAQRACQQACAYGGRVDGFLSSKAAMKCGIASWWLGQKMLRLDKFCQNSINSQITPSILWYRYQKIAM